MACLGYVSHMLGVYSVGMIPNLTSYSFFIMYTVRQLMSSGMMATHFSVDGVEVGWHHFQLCTTDTILIFVFCHCRYLQGNLGVLWCDGHVFSMYGVETK